MKNDYKNLDPNNKRFGDQLLKYFQKFLSKDINSPIKIGWIKKEDSLPLITITKGMDEIQKLYKNKIVSFDFNVWCNDKKTRDLITSKLVNLIKNVDFGRNFSVETDNEPLTIKIDVGAKEKSEIENKVIITAPQILNFEEKKGIYRCQFNLTMHLKVIVDKKELKDLKKYDEKCKFYDKLITNDLLKKQGIEFSSGIGGELIESKNKKYSLFRAIGDSKSLALIKDDKILWKKQFENIVSFDFANDGSYGVAVAQLTKKEMPSGYKSGGHVYLINRTGKIKDIKIPSDGLSCSISPDNKTFGVTTMGPEWGVYYFDSKGNNLWKKKFDKRVGGIELTTKQIILYDKMHKETRKEFMRLDNNGDITKR